MGRRIRVLAGFAIGAGIFSLLGCSYMGAKIETRKDGTVVARARYLNLFQNRRWEYDPETGKISLGSNNDPGVYAVGQVVPIAKAIK